MLFLLSADSFQNQLFRKILSGIPSESHTVSIQIRRDDLLDLIWLQTVCKGYQQKTLGGKELKAYTNSFAKCEKNKLKYMFVCLL